MKIQESAENYLETILILGKKNSSVRSIDIVNELEYSKASVSIAMKNLRENNYIIIDGDGYITLIGEGLKIAESMYERHTLLSDWLVFLGVDKKVAAEDACKIEHVISVESFEAIKKHTNEQNEKTSYR
ncbi:MAG: metal-dependent transcriptional regulator [Oscillospiraceae bacterium]